jgi:high-affinity Fe2+/Pb2+ permease
MKIFFRNYIILFFVFSIGLFLGEWLLDIVISSTRNDLREELIESIVIGAIVAILFVLGNKSLRENKTD